MDEHTKVDWRGLKALGVPYSRTHIWRMMAAGKFPQAFKLGKHRNSHPLWWLYEVGWLKAHASREARMLAP
jgi:predicted DNA-binding transcriptional regulator AlpA